MISITDDTGHVRYLGNIEPPQGLVKGWTVYGDVSETPMIARSEWTQHCREPFTPHPFLPPVAQQNGYGMCNASATCTGMEFARAQQGLPYVQLSGGDLYMRISGGRDQGSLLEDGIAASMSEGVASAKTVPYLDWRGENAGAREERKSYRVIEAFLCPTFEHCMSAVIAGYPIVTGIMWYSNFTPDADGWLPNGRGSAGGHAICGFAPVKRGSQYGIEHQNSWGASWGRNGRFVIPESHYGRQIGGWWSIRAVVDEGGVIPSET